MSVFLFPPTTVAPPNNSASPILLGDLFWSTNNEPVVGKLYGGQTYNWSENPKLKVLYDEEGHDFITDNGSTFTVLEYDGLLRGKRSAESVGQFGDDVVTTTISTGDEETRVVYFGIYGDAAIVAVDTTLANQGSLAVPSANEFASTLDISTAIANATPSLSIELPAGDTTLDETLMEEGVEYLVFKENPTDTNVRLNLAGDYLGYQVDSTFTNNPNQVLIESSVAKVFIENSTVFVSSFEKVSDELPLGNSKYLAPSQLAVKEYIVDELAKLPDYDVIEFFNSQATLVPTVFDLNREYLGIYKGSTSQLNLTPQQGYQNYNIETSFNISTVTNGSGTFNTVEVTSTVFKLIFNDNTLYIEPWEPTAIPPAVAPSLPRIISFKELGWNTGAKAQWTSFPITPTDISHIDTDIYTFDPSVPGRFTVLEDGDYWININYTTDPIGINAKYIFSLRENNLTGNEIIYFARGFTAIPGGSQNWGTSGGTMIPLVANQTIQVASFTDFNPVPGRFAALGVAKIG